MNLRQLEKLSKNPNYILSEKQILMLEEYRSQQLKNYKTKNIFKKHRTDIEEDNDGKSS